MIAKLSGKSVFKKRKGNLHINNQKRVNPVVLPQPLFDTQYDRITSINISDEINEKSFTYNLTHLAHSIGKKKNWAVSRRDDCDLEEGCICEDVNSGYGKVLTKYQLQKLRQTGISYLRKHNKTFDALCLLDNTFNFTQDLYSNSKESGNPVKIVNVINNTNNIEKTAIDQLVQKLQKNKISKEKVQRIIENYYMSSSNEKLKDIIVEDIDLNIQSRSHNGKCISKKRQRKIDQLKNAQRYLNDDSIIDVKEFVNKNNKNVLVSKGVHTSGPIHHYQWFKLYDHDNDNHLLYIKDENTQMTHHKKKEKARKIKDEKKNKSLMRRTGVFKNLY